MRSAASRPSRTAQTTRRGAAHDVAGGKHAVEVGHHASPVDLSVPQRVTPSSGAPNSAGRSSGSKPSALITRSAGDVGVGVGDLLAASGGRWRRARRAACAPTRTRPTSVPCRRKACGRGQPDELDAFLLGVLHLALRARHVGAVAAIEALHRLRRPGAPRCARSPSRCRRRRSPRRSCPWRRARRESKSGTASPRPLRLDAVR